MVPEYTSEVNGFNVTNTHAPGKTNISVTKAWDDNEDQDGIRPKSIKVTLLADGEDTGKSLTLNKDNHWTGTFDNLDEKKAGKKIVYTVKEEAVEGYESNITGDATQGYTVNNKHVPAVVDVAGKKTWEDKDNQDGVRPDKIVIRLLADGTEIQNKMVTADDNWEWSFTGLPKFKSGKEIVYTITEDAVKDYTSKVDKHDVTNTHAPGKTSLHVTKKWDDSNDKDKIRPGKVIIHLYADRKDTEKTLELSKSNN